MLEVDDSLAAYCLDGAVMTVGQIIENALHERVEVSDKEREPKYTLAQLLDPAFRLPRPQTERQKRKQAGANLRAMLGQGVKRLKDKTR